MRSLSEILGTGGWAVGKRDPSYSGGVPYQDVLRGSQAPVTSQELRAPEEAIPEGVMKELKLMWEGFDKGKRMVFGNDFKAFARSMASSVASGAGGRLAMDSALMRGPSS